MSEEDPVYTWSEAILNTAPGQISVNSDPETIGSHAAQYGGSQGRLDRAYARAAEGRQSRRTRAHCVNAFYWCNLGKLCSWMPLSRELKT